MAGVARRCDTYTIVQVVFWLSHLSRTDAPCAEYSRCFSTRTPQTSDACNVFVRFECQHPHTWSVVWAQLHKLKQSIADDWAQKGRWTCCRSFQLAHACARTHGFSRCLTTAWNFDICLKCSQSEASTLNGWLCKLFDLTASFSSFHFRLVSTSLSWTRP